MPYFAYGSNLHPERLRRRIPGSELIAAGRLRNHRLAFHKRSWVDDSGKCDVVPAAGETVCGALFRLPESGREDLAEFEGVGKGYEEVEHQIVTGSEATPAFLYRAQPEAVDGDLRPFDWYKALVLVGAQFHNFPVSYRAAIEAVRAVVDPDRERAAANWKLVEEFRER
jgi:gamma-glutamylcyclotransferase (GGCT)/AIG2-like uncharacterized protein YtfP